jgi:hypothetical protein
VDRIDQLVAAFEARRAVVAAHEEQFSPLSRREALRRLG